MTADITHIPLPPGTGVCAVDFDECTITLAFDSEADVRRLFASLPSRNRVRVIDESHLAASEWSAAP